MASLKNQHYSERTEHITLTQKAVSNEDTPSSIHSDVQSLEKVSYKSHTSKIISSNQSLNFILCYYSISTSLFAKIVNM